MKKILLIGQFTDEFRKINKALVEKYEVRACVNKLEIFKGMFKLNEPDVVVLIITELDKTNEELLTELRKEHRKMPVVCAGLKLEEEVISDSFKTKQFEYLGAEDTKVENIIEKIECSLEKDLVKEEFIEENERAKAEQNKDAEEADEVKEDDNQGENARKTIMLVDDSGVYLRMMKGLLEEKYDIIMTTSGIKAITMIHEKKPDLVLLDYEMPMFDGRETMVKIRESEECRDIPIVFVTAVNDKEHIKAVLALKPAAYLLKPIDKDRVFKTIKDIIGT